MDEQVNQASEAVETQSPEERFEAILEAEDSTEQPEVTEEVVETEVEASEDGETDDTYEEVEEDVADTEESEEDEPEVEEIKSYRVKANGEEKEVELDELIKSYQLGQDYTVKTQKLSEERKQLEAEAKKVQEAVQLGEQYAQRLQQVEQLLMNNNAEVDLDDLKENDPIQYAIKVAEQTETRKKLDAVRQEQYRVKQTQEAQRQEALGKHIQSEAVKTAELIEGFSDKKKGEQIKSDIRSFGKSIGFSDDELAQVYDSRHVNVLYKAMKYDRLMKNKASVNKKVAAAPVMAKSKARVPDTKSHAYRNQRKALRETGSSDAAQSVFESILSQ